MEEPAGHEGASILQHLDSNDSMHTDILKHDSTFAPFGDAVKVETATLSATQGRRLT